MKPRSRHEAEQDGYDLGQSFRRHGIGREQAHDQVLYTLPRFIGPLWESHAPTITVAYWAGYKGL